MIDDKDYWPGSHPDTINHNLALLRAELVNISERLNNLRALIIEAQARIVALEAQSIVDKD